MHNGRKTNMNTRQPRPAASFAGRSKRWSSNAARPEQNGSHNARRNYERYLALAQAEAQSGNIVGAENYYQHAEHYFRCPRTEERHRRLRCNDCCYQNGLFLSIIWSVPSSSKTQTRAIKNKKLFHWNLPVLAGLLSIPSLIHERVP